MKRYTYFYFRLTKVFDCSIDYSSMFSSKNFGSLKNSFHVDLKIV